LLTLLRRTRALCGVASAMHWGIFFVATVLANVSKDMAVAREETFGPLATLFRFKDEADVIERADDTEFGLASYLYARDLPRAFRVAEALEYGMVDVNTGLISTAEAQFGGVKLSGLGREDSKYGIEELTEINTSVLVVSVDEESKPDG
jgi:succinate-semialdehyde dehydrogenase/glutarate-semialdehyde dehydrogenase